MIKGGSGCFQLLPYHQNYLETLRYSSSLLKKLQRLFQVVVDKDKSSNWEKRSLEVAQNRTGELDKTLKESQDDH